MALLTSKSTAARLLDLLNGAARRVTRPAFAARVAPRGKLLPWTVKWSNRLDSIIIYIPPEAVVGRTMNVTRLEHATNAEGNTMPNWYLVDMTKASHPDEVRVALYETDSGMDVDIATPGSGETPVARVLIARISLPTGSTVTPVVITQIVTSALSDIYLADPEEDPAALLNRDLYTPELNLSYTPPTAGTNYDEASPAKIQVSIPYTNPKTGATGTTTKTIQLTGLTGGGGAADLPEPVELTVVTGIEYANNQLTMKTQVVQAYLAAAPAAETATTIFTATPHSEEHS